MRIVLATVWNEESILPWFLRHYFDFVKCDLAVFYDNGSTDRTREIIKADHRCELREWDTGGKYDTPLQTAKKNEMWREFSGAEWVIVADADEFLWAPNLSDIMGDEKYTSLEGEWTQMVSESFPVDDGRSQLTDIVSDGCKWDLAKHQENKCVAFRPARCKVEFGHGCHTWSIAGEIAVCSEVKVLHYRWLGAAYSASRNSTQVARLPKDTNFSHHLHTNGEEQWKKFMEASKSIINAPIGVTV